jgi:hypothetical protein
LAAVLHRPCCIAMAFCMARPREATREMAGYCSKLI